MFVNQAAIDALPDVQGRRTICSAHGSINGFSAYAEQMIVNQEQTRTTANTSMVSVIFDT